MLLPSGVHAFARRGPEWAAFVDRLPRLAAELLYDWELSRDGEALHGYGSLVLPVRTAAGTPGALKIAWDGDDETEFEHLALQRWGGRGAVRLLRAEPSRRALLLERLYPDDLASVGYLEAAEIAASLYSALHVPAPPQLRTVTSYVERWLPALEALPGDAPIPHRYVRQALSLFRDLATDPASTGTLVHHDLHDHNVLAGDREPWLAIDPQPMSGDPHYEPAPLLWNRWEEVVARGAVRADVRGRFHAILDTAGLDEERATAWVVVRMVLNAYWTIEDAARMAGPLDGEQRDWITRCVAIVKAVQD